MSQIQSVQDEVVSELAKRGFDAAIPQVFKFNRDGVKMVEMEQLFLQEILALAATASYEAGKFEGTGDGYSRGYEEGYNDGVADGPAQAGDTEPEFNPSKIEAVSIILDVLENFDELESDSVIEAVEAIRD